MRECSGARVARQDADVGMAMPPPAYAELHCLSDFTFLRGASSAAQLFERARACGYQALAITDECSLAGIVRAFEASRNTGVPLIVGSEFRLVDGTRFVLLVQDQAGYEALCSLITTGARRRQGLLPAHARGLHPPRAGSFRAALPVAAFAASG